MKKWSRVAWLGCVALAACSQTQERGPAERSELRPVDTDEAQPESAPAPEESARAYALNQLASVGALRRADLKALSTRTGAGGITHVRMQQVLDGVRVFGGDVVVHSVEGKVIGMGGNAGTGLDGFDVTAALASDLAMDIAKRDYVGDATGSFTYEREAKELVVLPREGQAPRLVWHVRFFTELQNGKDPGLWNYFIDAKNGEVVEKFNGIHTLSQASGPGGNAKVTRSWSSALDVEASGSAFTMDTARLRTVDMKNSQSGSGTIVTGPLDNIGDAAINDAHGFAEVTLNMLQEWMGYNSIDERGFKVVSRVHYGRNYENAFWDGSKMTYGDGASLFYPLSGAVDVTSHEINHGFTSFHSNLTYSGQSGGINESFSDVAGTIAEFYYKGTAANWDVGEDVFKSATGALRYMCEPTRDGRSIDNAANYRNGIDVHYSSGVFNKAFCLAAKRLGSGSPTGAATVESIKRAGKAWYEANDNFWTAGTTFVQGCKGVLDAASALGYSSSEITALQQSFADVGVTCGSSPPPPNQAPTATITAPANGSTVSGTVTVTANASDADGTVAKVVFTLPDGTTVEDTTAPYSATWDSTGTKDGSTVAISAKATDDKGATSTAASVSVTVDNGTGGGGDCVSGTFAATDVPLSIPDNNTTGVTSTIKVSGAGTVASVALNLDIQHTYRGDLVVTLVGPDGTSYSVSNRQGRSADNIVITGQALTAFQGKVAAGDWKLSVRDAARVDTGSIRSWSLSFSGCGIAP